MRPDNGRGPGATSPGLADQYAAKHTDGSESTTVNCLPDPNTWPGWAWPVLHDPENGAEALLEALGPRKLRRLALASLRLVRGL